MERGGAMRGHEGTAGTAGGAAIDTAGVCVCAGHCRGRRPSHGAAAACVSQGTVWGHTQQ
jgi:hypothetical protein